jgi:hypothetical protein
VPVVVEDEVDVKRGGHPAVDRVEELAELDAAVAAVTLAEYSAGFFRRPSWK